MVKTKMIKVASRGYVTTSRGRALGPITRPYREAVSMIFNMISKERATVIEVVDGREVELNLQNFDKDNSAMPVQPVAAPVKNEPKQQVKPVVEEKKEEAPVDVVTATEEVKPVEETPDLAPEKVEGEDEVNDDTEEKEDESETINKWSNDKYNNKKFNKKNHGNRDNRQTNPVTPESV